MIKKIILIAIMLISAFSINAQVLRPNNLPTTNSPSRFDITGYQMDSAFLSIIRSTFPAKYPSLIRKTVDSAFWYTNGGWAGAPWYKLIDEKDTSTMLVPYLRKIDTALMLTPYHAAFYNASFDTATRIFSLIPITGNPPITFVIPRGGSVNGINTVTSSRVGNLLLQTGDNGYSWLSNINNSDSATRLHTTDTAVMLSPYLRKTDTATMLAPFVQYSDTAQMLSNLLRKTDTSAMLNSYLRKSDTAAAFSAHINGTINYVPIFTSPHSIGNSDISKSGNTYTYYDSVNNIARLNVNNPFHGSSAGSGYIAYAKDTNSIEPNIHYGGFDVYSYGLTGTASTAAGYMFIRSGGHTKGIINFFDGRDGWRVSSRKPLISGQHFSYDIFVPAASYDYSKPSRGVGFGYYNPNIQMIDSFSKALTVVGESTASLELVNSAASIPDGTIVGQVSAFADTAANKIIGKISFTASGSGKNSGNITIGNYNGGFYSDAIKIDKNNLIYVNPSDTATLVVGANTVSNGVNSKIESVGNVNGDVHVFTGINLSGGGSARVRSSLQNSNYEYATLFHGNSHSTSPNTVAYSNTSPNGRYEWYNNGGLSATISSGGFTTTGTLSANSFNSGVTGTDSLVVHDNTTKQLKVIAPISSFVTTQYLTPFSATSLTTVSPYVNFSVTGNVTSAAHVTIGGTSSDVVLGNGALGTYISGANNGITNNGGTIQLGGTLIQNTTVTHNSNSMSFIQTKGMDNTGGLGINGTFSMSTLTSQDNQQLNYSGTYGAIGNPSSSATVLYYKSVYSGVNGTSYAQNSGAFTGGVPYSGISGWNIFANSGNLSATAAVYAKTPALQAGQTANGIVGKHAGIWVDSIRGATNLSNITNAYGIYQGSSLDTNILAGVNQMGPINSSSNITTTGNIQAVNITSTGSLNTIGAGGYAGSNQQFHSSISDNSAIGSVKAVARFDNNCSGCIVRQTWSDNATADFNFTYSPSGTATSNIVKWSVGTGTFSMDGNGLLTTSLGTGAVQATAGVLSVVSDSKVKDKMGLFKGTATEAIMKLPKPEYWKYNSKSKLPKETWVVKQFGMYADSVHSVLGEEFAPTQPQSKSDSAAGIKNYGLSDRALLSLTIQALQEANKKIESLDARVAKLEAILNKK